MQFMGQYCLCVQIQHDFCMATVMNNEMIVSTFIQLDTHCLVVSTQVSVYLN